MMHIHFYRVVRTDNCYIHVVCFEMREMSATILNYKYVQYLFAIQIVSTNTALDQTNCATNVMVLFR